MEKLKQCGMPEALEAKLGDMTLAAEVQPGRTYVSTEEELRAAVAIGGTVVVADRWRIVRLLIAGIRQRGGPGGGGGPSCVLARLPPITSRIGRSVLRHVVKFLPRSIITLSGDPSMKRLLGIIEQFCDTLEENDYEGHVGVEDMRLPLAEMLDADAPPAAIRTWIEKHKDVSELVELSPELADAVEVAVDKFIGAIAPIVATDRAGDGWEGGLCGRLAGQMGGVLGPYSWRPGTGPLIPTARNVCILGPGTIRGGTTDEHGVDLGKGGDYDYDRRWDMLQIVGSTHVELGGGLTIHGSISVGPDRNAAGVEADRPPDAGDGGGSLRATEITIIGGVNASNFDHLREGPALGASVELIDVDVRDSPFYGLNICDGAMATVIRGSVRSSNAGGVYTESNQQEYTINRGEPNESSQPDPSPPTAVELTDVVVAGNGGAGVVAGPRVTIIVDNCTVENNTGCEFRADGGVIHGISADLITEDDY
jgi:hypothetical protein